MVSLNRKPNQDSILVHVEPYYIYILLVNFMVWGMVFLLLNDLILGSMTESLKVILKSQLDEKMKSLKLFIAYMLLNAGGDSC